MNSMLAPIINQHKITEPQKIQIRNGNQQMEKEETFKTHYKTLLKRRTFEMPQGINRNRRTKQN